MAFICLLVYFQIVIEFNFLRFGLVKSSIKQFFVATKGKV